MPETETDCLHCEINDLVREYIEEHDSSNLPDLVAKMAESLVELIQLGPEEQWGNLLAVAIQHLGTVYLADQDAGGSGRAH